VENKEKDTDSNVDLREKIKSLKEKINGEGQ
jgi:hypothetical protein